MGDSFDSLLVTMEVDMLASFNEFDNDNVATNTMQRLVITVHDDIVSEDEAYNIAVAIQRYLDPSLIEWEITKK